LDSTKVRWSKDLIEVLWAYKCAPQSSTKETLFSLMCDIDSMIPIDICEPSSRRQRYDESSNGDCLHVDWDLLIEMPKKAQIQEVDTKKRATRKYNSKLKLRAFQNRDLVWRMANNARKIEGKFSANWEGPFRVVQDADKGAYRLEYLSAQPIPNTWNIT